MEETHLEGMLPFFLAFSVILSFFISLSRKALIRFSHVKFEERISEMKHGNRFLALLDKKDEFLDSLYILKLLSYLLVAFLIYFATASKEGALVGEMGIGFFLSAGLVLVFLETLARVAVRRNPEAILLTAFPVIRILWRISFPIWASLKVCERVFSGLLGTSASESPAEKAEEEILSAVEEGEREGVIHEDEKEMIESIIEFKDLEVSEIMIPRTDMVSISSQSSVKDAIRLAIEKGHSRLPVHQKNQDNVIGILYVKDLLTYWVKENQEDPFLERIQLKDITRKPHFVPETKKIGELLREFQSNKVHMAIVLDEYGGTSGLVTIEDILEEIVGEIEDEYDSETPKDIRMIGENTAEVDAKVHIDTLNEKMQLHLPEGNGFDTVGGLAFSYLGKVPKAGEKFTFHGIEFSVIEADERKIKRLKVSQQEPLKNGKNEE